MSRSYARGRGGGTRTVPTRTQITPGQTETDPSGVPLCSGHQRRAKQFTSGPSTKNAGRVFYTCPLGRDDPTRCKYFQWADELDGAGNSQRTPTKAVSTMNTGGGGGQTLGQSPMAVYGRPRPPPTPADNNASTSNRTGAPARQASVSDDDIDWEQVDADDLEREAIASTPGSSQRTASLSQTPTAAPNSSYKERMRAAVEDGLGKRKREDEEESTPKKASDEHNPFMSPSSTTGLSPPHRFLSPALSSLSHVSEELYRQERLLTAAEKAKEVFRKTIRNLQDRNKELEERVKELEKRLDG